MILETNSCVLRVHLHLKSWINTRPRHTRIPPWCIPVCRVYGCPKTNYKLHPTQLCIIVAKTKRSFRTQPKNSKRNGKKALMGLGTRNQHTHSHDLRQNGEDMCLTLYDQFRNSVVRPTGRIIRMESEINNATRWDTHRSGHSSSRQCQILNENCHKCNKY